MSLREDNIKEITEALQNADDKILKIVYTIVMLTTEFSERTRTQEEINEIKKDKPQAPVKKVRTAAKVENPTKIEDLEDFDFAEEAPKSKSTEKKPIEDVDDDFDFEESEPKPVEKKSEPKKEVNDDFEDFDEDFSVESTPEPVKAPEPVVEPVKEEPVEVAKSAPEPVKEEKKEESKNDFDDFDFDDF